MNSPAPIPPDCVYLTRHELDQIKNGFTLLNEGTKTLDFRITKLEASHSTAQVQDSDTAKELARLIVQVEQVQQRLIEYRSSNSLLADVGYQQQTLSRDLESLKSDGKERSKQAADRHTALMNGLKITAVSLAGSFFATQIFPYLGYNRTAQLPRMSSSINVPR
jgi:uncharacterized membrane protein YccC